MIFRIVGTLTFTEDALRQLNEVVSQLLNVCGIRWYETKILPYGSKEIPVTIVPEPDRSGKLYFNYSIFEKELRQPSWFDTRTGMLFAEDQGYKEFALAMNLIMTAQECFSATPCCLVKDDLPFSLYSYCAMIQSMTDKKLRTIWRERPIGLMAHLSKQYSFINYAFAKTLSDKVSKSYTVCSETMQQEYQEISRIDEHDLDYFVQLKDRSIHYEGDTQEPKGSENLIYWDEAIGRENADDCLIIPEFFLNTSGLMLSKQMWSSLAEAVKDVQNHIEDAGEYSAAETAKLLEILCTYFGIESIDMRLVRVLAEEKTSPAIRSAVHVLTTYVKEDVMRFPELNEEYAYRFSKKYCTSNRTRKIYVLLCLMTEQHFLQRWNDRER